MECSQRTYMRQVLQSSTIVASRFTFPFNTCTSSFRLSTEDFSELILLTTVEWKASAVASAVTYDI